MMNSLFDPSQILAHLEKAERHVRDGELRVERQRTLLAKLRVGGHPTDEAEILLARFQDILRELNFHRNRLRQELREKTI